MDASGWKSPAETGGQTRTRSTSAADTPTKQENRPAFYGTYPPPTITKINFCQKVDSRHHPTVGFHFGHYFTGTPSPLRWQLYVSQKYVTDLPFLSTA